MKGTPNLFILGAGKCGTTALYDLLASHEEIHVCHPKEPSFFCSHFQVVRDPIAYFGMFRSERRYRVDASHVYFSNPETPPVLHGLFPEAKFILILRHPKARAHSLYRHMRRSIHSDGRPFELVESFHEALSVEDRRSVAPAFASGCRQYFWNFMYVRSSMYDVQLLRYLGLFPLEQFLILTLAELDRQPEAVLSKIAAFLGVSREGFSRQMPISNAAPAYATFDAECDALMEERFGGLTTRVDAIVGRSLDWSR